MLKSERFDENTALDRCKVFKTGNARACLAVIEIAGGEMAQAGLDVEKSQSESQQMHGKQPKPRACPQVVLSMEQALDIFSQRHSQGDRQSLTAKSTALAATFGISAKTVRDIWCGRSWLDATFDLWPQASCAEAA